MKDKKKESDNTGRKMRAITQCLLEENVATEDASSEIAFHLVEIHSELPNLNKILSSKRITKEKLHEIYSILFSHLFYHLKLLKKELNKIGIED